jgi:hypothetical protein
MPTDTRAPGFHLCEAAVDPPPAWFLEWFVRLPRSRQQQFVVFCQDISKFSPGTRLPTFDEWTASLC